MAQLQYPTSASVKPPLFLSKEKLFELDKIIEDHLPQIEKENERNIEVDYEYIYGRAYNSGSEAAEKAKQEFFDKKRKERKLNLTIYFKEGTKLHAASFREVSRHAEMNSAPAEGFSLSLAYRPIDVNIRMSDRKSEMAISASPPDNPAVTELYGDLKNWAQSVAPRPWQRIWVSSDHGFDILLWMICIFFALSVFLPNKQDQSKSYFQNQAKELLKHGVDASNERKAMETLLAIESGYEGPPTSSPPPSRRSIAFVVGALISCLIYSIPPRSVIGIGRGQKLLEGWNRWLAFISVTVPTYLASVYLWPKLAALLSSIFK